MKNELGFTLIEVMVALMIIAVIAVAASQASSGYLRTVEGMKTRTLAHFVAQNQSVQLKINNEWLTSEKQETIEQQGKTWQVTYLPSETEMPDIQSVEISAVKVLESEQNGVKTGAGSSVSILLTKPEI